MKNIKGVLYCWLLLTASVAAAYEPQEGKISATLGPYLLRTDFRGSETGATSPYLGGLGLIVTGDVNDRGSLEIGLFGMNKVYFRERAGAYLAEQTMLTHVTMGYRRWLSSLFSASLSIYSAYSMGQIQQVHSDFVPGTEPPTSAHDITEYGFDASFMTELWSREKASIVLDLRYSFSVTSKENEISNHTAALVGYRYLVQEKEEKRDAPPEKPRFR